MRENRLARHSRTVRGFCGPDVDRVMEILGESPEAAGWSRDSVLEAAEEAGALALIIEESGDVIGFLIGRLVRDQAEVLNLGVARTRRRSGAGGALLEAAMRDFRANGGVSVYLEVRESNESAIAFYAKYGFSKVGHRKDYYQDPAEAAVTMARKLAS